MLKKAIKLNYTQLKIYIGISAFFFVFVVMAAFLMGYYSNHIFFAVFASAVFIDIFAGVNELFGKSLFGDGADFLQTLPISRRSELAAKLLLCGLWITAVMFFMILVFIKAFSHPFFLGIWGFKEFQALALYLTSMDLVKYPLLPILVLFLLSCVFCLCIGTLQILINFCGRKRRKGQVIGFATIIGGLLGTGLSIAVVRAMEGTVMIVAGILFLLVVIVLLGWIWIKNMENGYDLA